MEEYMTTRFPARALWRMFAGPPPPFHREFVIEYAPASAPTETRKQRHLSFASKEEFVRCMQQRRPQRLDIGPTYAIPPAQERLFPDGCQEILFREITIDVDIDAYDKPPFRLCCRGRDVCASCWQMVAIGCAIVDAGVRMLGADAVGWFFSGGRGMHCWVLDSDVPPLGSPDKAERVAVAEQIVPGDPLTILDRAVQLRDPYALEIVGHLVPVDARVPYPAQLSARPSMFTCTRSAGDQCECPLHFEQARGMFLGWYADRHPASAIIAIRSRLAASAAAASALAGLRAPARAVFAGLAQEREREKGRTDVGMRWLAARRADMREPVRQIEAVFDALTTATRADVMGMFGMGNGAAPSCVGRAVIEAALLCLMPRIDRPVVENTNHLLKAPLSAHPLTRRLAMRVEPRDFFAFLPTQAPMLLANGKGVFDDELCAQAALRDFDKWTKSMKR